MNAFHNLFFGIRQKSDIEGNPSRLRTDRMSLGELNAPRISTGTLSDRCRVWHWQENTILATVFLSSSNRRPTEERVGAIRESLLDSQNWKNWLPKIDFERCFGSIFHEYERVLLG